MIPRKQLEEIAQAVQGIPVWGALNGSPSAQAGVRYGDILLGVNGMRTTNIDDYLAARKLRTDGVELLVLRDGKECTFHLEFSPANANDVGEMVEQVIEGRFVSSTPTHTQPKGAAN
jgi:S1-C subfamily serine protease